MYNMSSEHGELKKNITKNPLVILSRRGRNAVGYLYIYHKLMSNVGKKKRKNAFFPSFINYFNYYKFLLLMRFEFR